jgi:hypothetical protein
MDAPTFWNLFGELWHDLPPRVLPQIKLVRQQVPAPARRAAGATIRRA